MFYSKWVFGVPRDQYLHSKYLLCLLLPSDTCVMLPWDSDQHWLGSTYLTTVGPHNNHTGK